MIEFLVPTVVVLAGPDLIMYTLFIYVFALLIYVKGTDFAYYT